ncbi:hypothetical protein LCI18_013492 [Fusarium solani-melongenae]|uniref:Uncharacterized protein n=1 Tax=Fusarium solani subsp. cucurbitae TaxID=2747967 RepID=A0ACD3ZMZ2_FUSSC|nr:hypothetical protein LCI18_013492 [Fusarium solani-melongenae]
MYLSAFPHLLRAPGEDSGPCSSLIIQPSYRTRHIANTFKKPGSRSLTPSACNANGRGGQDKGQCLAVLYPDPFFLAAQCQLTVDGHVDWDLNQTLANLSTFIEPVSVDDIKLLSSFNALPPCASQKGNLPFPPWFWAFLLLKLFLIQCLGNESHPSSTPFNTKHTLSFGNDQGSNKKPRQDDNDENDDPYDPDDYGDNGRDHDNNDGETPEGIGVAKGKDKEKALFCCVFHKLDPVRWPICGQRRLTSFAYLLQHLRRQHLMKFKGHFYCPKCRTVWPPEEEDSEDLWAAHKRDDTCEEVTAADTGMLLPDEYEAIKGSKSAGSDLHRWYETWKMLFRDYDAPDTPYSEDLAQGTEASILCKLKRSLKKRLSTLPPGALQDAIKSLTDDVLEDVFPAYAMRGSANAGPSTFRVLEHTPQTIGRHGAPVTAPASTPAPAPRHPGPVISTRTPAGHRAPPPRPAPNTSHRHPPPNAFPANPGLMMNQGLMSTGLATNHRTMNPSPWENPAFAIPPGRTNPRPPVDPTLIPGNPALRMNSGMMNPADPRYGMISRQANIGLADYGPPANLGHSIDTIDPSLLTNSGLPNTRSPANPGPSAPPPSNPINIQYPNRNASRRNNTNAFDHAAFALGVGRGIEAFNSLSQDPEQPSDTDDYPETVQNPWRRVR